MAATPRSTFARRLARAALRVFAVLALVVLSGITVQARAERSDRARFPPPGTMVDIGGGQQIHVREWLPAGDLPGGGPTIVLDVSAAMPLSEWAWVAPGLAAAGHHVVAYDRPGMGWSTGPWQPRDAAHAADALRRALDAAGIEGPYVVVGHSYGGFSARVFTAQNPEDVAGLVLLDTTHPEGGGELAIAAVYRLRAWQGHAGLFHLGPRPDALWELPEPEREAANAVSVWASHLDASAEELEAWRTSAEQLRATPNFGDLPLLVVTTHDTAYHVALQLNLLRLSTASRFEQLPVNHMGMLVNRDQATLTVGAIDRFVKAL